MGFKIVHHEPVRVVRCEALSVIPGIAHGFSTRQGTDGEDFDLGRAACPDEDASRRQRGLLLACDLDGRSPVDLVQVHGNRVLNLADLDTGSLARGDAIVALRSDRERGAPGVRYADCLPVLLADRQGRAVAAVHAGWRGTAEGVARRVVEALAGLGIAPEGLVAALGPAIGPCCYEVGAEVLEAVAEATGVGVECISRGLPGGPRALDLPEANRRQLIESGVRPDALYRAPWCTHCDKSLFFSHRRQGSGAGRMLARIGWATEPPLP